MRIKKEGVLMWVAYMAWLLVTGYITYFTSAEVQRWYVEFPLFLAVGLSLFISNLYLMLAFGLLVGGMLFVHSIFEFEEER